MISELNDHGNNKISHLINVVAKEPVVSRMAFVQPVVGAALEGKGGNQNLNLNLKTRF